MDKEQHIEALYQIVHLAENHQILDDLLENVTKEKSHANYQPISN